MSADTLEELVKELKDNHGFSDGSISLLKDKGLGEDEFSKLLEIMMLPDQTFSEWDGQKSWIEKALERAYSGEITTGRYNRYVKAFNEISSEQALVKGRMMGAVEYDIRIAELLSKYPEYQTLVSRPFTDSEKDDLRLIYTKFLTKDCLAVQLIEKKTNHDIVAANTWLTVLAQLYGMDDQLMRGITHIARTSSDLNTNVNGRLYMMAIGQWTKSLSNLVGDFQQKALRFPKLTCMAETHGQDAQLTTLGHIYANLTEQVKMHASPLLGKEKLIMDGKIAGAIGTEVDARAAFPNVDLSQMHKDIVENVFGLRYVRYGNDQDCSNAALSQALDVMVNVDYVVKKAATDLWMYASRGVLSKMTGKGESGSSLMPQKTNPFLAEGSEALMSIVSSMVNPIKEMIVSYREQGDLRRSITKREGFHPIMLSIIAMERLREEIKKYEPNIVAIESEVYSSGPKVISSAINTRLRAKGVPDAYDRIKDIVMRPYVRPEQIVSYISDLRVKGDISEDTELEVIGMLRNVMDNENIMQQLWNSTENRDALIKRLYDVNQSSRRLKLVGTAVSDTYQMAHNARKTQELLLRYGNQKCI